MPGREMRRRLIFSCEHRTRRLPSVQPNSSAISVALSPLAIRAGIRSGSIFLSLIDAPPIGCLGLGRDHIFSSRHSNGLTLSRLKPQYALTYELLDNNVITMILRSNRRDQLSM